MVKSISNVSVSSYYNFQVKKQAKQNLPKGINLSQSTDNISFKAGFPVEKAIKPSSIKNASTSLRGLVIALLTSLGLGASNYVREKKDKQLEDYRVLYPELMKYLDESGDTFGHYGTFHGAYTDEAKRIIVEVYKVDPQRAKALSEKLYFDHSQTYSEELLKTIESDYEELKRYNFGNLDSAYQRMEITRKNPQLSCIPNNTKISPIELEKFSEYCTEKESKEALVNVTAIVGEIFSEVKAERCMEISDLYKKYPDMPSEVISALYCYGVNDQSKAVVAKYSGKWDELLKILKRTGTSEAFELEEYMNFPEHVDFTKYYYHESKGISRKEYIKRLFLTEDILKKLVAKTPYSLSSNYLDDLNEMLYGLNNRPIHHKEEILHFINTLDADNVKNYERMLEDGYCCSVSHMMKLLPLYKQHPNEKITWSMVEEFDPPERYYK